MTGQTSAPLLLPPAVPEMEQLETRSTCGHGGDGASDRGERDRGVLRLRTATQSQGRTPSGRGVARPEGDAGIRGRIPPAPPGRKGGGRQARTRERTKAAGEVLPPSNALTGPASPGRSVCVPASGLVKKSSPVRTMT